MIALVTNYVIGSTITASTENPDYDFTTAFNDDRLSRVGRTVSDTSQTIIFDLLSAVAVSKFMLKGHNLTSSATITLDGNDTNVWTAPAYTTSITYNADYIYKDLVTDQTYRYWRLSISDASNPDDYIELSKIYLGSFVQFPNMKKDQKIPVASTGQSSISESGQVYGNRGYTYRYGTINFSNMTNTERQTINTMFLAVDKIKPFFMLIWESDLLLESPIYNVLTTDLQWTREDSIGLRWGLSLSFREIF